MQSAEYYQTTMQQSISCQQAEVSHNFFGRWTSSIWNFQVNSSFLDFSGSVKLFYDWGKLMETLCNSQWEIKNVRTNSQSSAIDFMA